MSIKVWSANENAFAADLNNNFLFVVPTGAIIPFAGSAAPTNWLLCNGATVSQATYAALYALIGHTYGADPGGGNFILPDLRARVPVGVNADGDLGSGATKRTNKALAAVAGEETHVLTVAEMPAHAHVYQGDWGGVSGPLGASGKVPSNTNTSSVGSDNAHQNLQPYIGLNFIIKV